jgi:hypothetical protein
MTTPIFNHGKNAFLALGFAEAANSDFPGLTGSVGGNGVPGGTADTALTLSATGTFAQINTPPVPGSDEYGAFVGGVPIITTDDMTSTSAVTLGEAVNAGGIVLPMYNISPWINDVDLPISIDPNETTTFSRDGVKTYIVGLKGWSLTFSGMYDQTDGSMDYWISQMEAYQDTPGQFITFVYGPADPGQYGGSTIAPSVKYYGQGILTKYDVKSSVSGVVTFDSEIQPTGKVWRTII